MGGSKRSKDGQKTKKELIAELEELRREVSDQKSEARGKESGQPTLTADISRRDALKIAWVAPVILSVPLGSAGTARKAQAGTVPPTMMPTTELTRSPTSPTSSPTNSPTSEPTTSPSISPTSEPTTSPTSSPTVSPTNSDSTLEPPTVAMEPTLAPTAFPSVRAVPAASTGAAAAAAAALFGFGVKKLRDQVASEPEIDDSSSTGDEPDDDDKT